MKRPDHRVCIGISHVAMCGLRWVNGMHFGARPSTCEECERKVKAQAKRMAPYLERKKAAAVKRSQAYYNGGR